MDYCEDCQALENRFRDRTEHYTSLVEQQDRMFRERNPEGRKLDSAIAEAKIEKEEAEELLRAHRTSHSQ
jgi:hypothetical protein